MKLNETVRLFALTNWLMAALALALAGCSVDREEFNQRLFGCNPNAADPACGTDHEGEPMACVAAYQLGGRNFCAASCDRALESADGDGAGVCLAAGRSDAGRLSGAKLQKCSPDTGDPGCGSELSCLRTDLLRDEGVCMTLTPCATNSDCRDPVRAVCMGELLRSTYGAKAGLKAENTYCVQFGCNATGAACSPGESCLRKLIPRESNPPDICVPNCDSNRNCPPNYFCYPDVYSKPSPAICIPGLMGLRCRSKMDCLLGDCMDTGAGFNVCTVACQDDNDCAKFDSEQGTFFCNDQKHCAGPRAFRGSICLSQDDCRSGETCASLTPDSRYGFCLFACGEGGACPSYGGVAHTCLPQLPGAGPPVCWPGYFGQPCAVDAQCIGGLSCRPTLPDRPKICSTLCVTDQDCQRNRFAKDGWCQPQLTVCLSPLKDDTPCERDVQCESKKCINDPKEPGKKKCDKTPGY